MADLVPPALGSLTFATSINLSGGARLWTVSASAFDAGAGVDDVVVWFDRPLVTDIGSFNLFGLYGFGDSWADGRSAETRTVLTANNPGTINITRVTTTDLAGNARTYLPAELQALGISTAMSIVSGAPASANTQLQAPSVVREGENAAIELTIDFSNVSTLQTTLGVRATIASEDGLSQSTAIFSQTSNVSVTKVPAGPHVERITIPLVDDLTNRGSQIVSVEVTASNRVFPDGGNSTAARITVLDNDITRQGTVGDDVIEGSRFTDALLGQQGNDILIGRQGNDTLDGGIGRDIAIFNVARGTSTLSRDSSQLIGPEGTDTLVAVERLRFLDGTLCLDIALPGQGDSNAGTAYRMYEAAFNRTPDTLGLAFWIRHLDSGRSLLDMAQSFIESSEFRQVYGLNPSAEQLVYGFYDNVLGRPPEPSGFAFWLGQLVNRPDQRANVLANIANSPENQDSLIGMIGFGIWLEGEIF